MEASALLRIKRIKAELDKAKSMFEQARIEQSEMIFQMGMWALSDAKILLDLLEQEKI